MAFVYKVSLSEKFSTSLRGLLGLNLFKGFNLEDIVIDG